MIFWTQWTITSISIIVSGLILYIFGFEFILANDKTYLSFLIIAIFAYATIIISYMAYKYPSGESVDQPFWSIIEYCRWSVTRLGLLGTIIGLILMLAVFRDIDVTNIEELKQSLGDVAGGMGTALITTMVGSIAGLILTAQKTIAEYSYFDEKN